MVYDNPLDNVQDLAHIFFQRCLAAQAVSETFFVSILRWCPMW